MNNKNAKSDSSYSPKSIGGRIDELIREKLMNADKQQTNEQDSKKSIQGKGKKK